MSTQYHTPPRWFQERSTHNILGLMHDRLMDLEKWLHDIEHYPFEKDTSLELHQLNLQLLAWKGKDEVDMLHFLVSGLLHRFPEGF